MLVLVDQDGVLADFEAGFRASWEREGHAHPVVQMEQRKSFYISDDYPAPLKATVEGLYAKPGFFRDLLPIPGAIEGIRQLQESGHDVRICTSPLNVYRNCVLEKYEWVENHLGAEFVSRMMLTKDKTVVLGDILIDDKPKITGSRTPSWQHIIFDQPYNQGAPGLRMHWGAWRNAFGQL